MSNTGAADANGQSLEILAISAGSGNGWEFSEAVLRDSLPLWQGCECFIDHSWCERSVRDLAGVCSDPGWDEGKRGIRLHLKAVGPAADLLTSLAAALQAESSPQPDLGFSADLLFNADNTLVTRILKVFSVDLVMHPARGGMFLAPQIQSQKEKVDMEEVQTNMSENGLKTAGGLQTAGSLKGENARLTAVTAGSAAANTDLDGLRLQLCATLLESSLSAAHLPEAVEKRLRSQFGGHSFAAQELTSAIQDARQLISDISAGALVQSGASIDRISDMAAPEDQITAALHDLMGVPRPAGMESLRSARLSGIREFYTRMTGDLDFSGGYFGERAQFAVSANLPGVLKNVMNKLILARWEELGRSGYRWWEPVVQVEHFNSLQEISGVLVGEVNVLPAVNEGEAYTELAVSDSSETGTWGKYGGYVGLTLEMFERDETHKLRQYPAKLASAALRRISALVGAVFTTNNGVGLQMSDSYKVFDASHHNNLGTTALSTSAWEAAGQAIYSQPLVIASGATAPKLALDARYLLVPRGLRLSGMQILYPSFSHESNIFSENMQQGQMGDVITVPEFTDANDWAALADPRLAPGIILGERFGVMPEIIIADGETNGALFSNDEIRMKVRHWVSVFVADYRPLFKANVA
jgi:hypothetical protein